MDEFNISFEEAMFSLRQSWEVHRQAFGPILEPAFVNKPQVRVVLVNALNHISRHEVKQAMELLKQISENCDCDEDKAAWTYFVGLCFEFGGAKEEMLQWYEKAAKYKHHFYLPYLKLAKAAHLKEQYKIAREYYETAIECVLEMPIHEQEEIVLGSAYTNLTACLTLLHQYHDAETAWQRAQQYPLQPGSHSTAAVLYAAMGDKEKTDACIKYLKDLENADHILFGPTKEMTQRILAGKHPQFPLDSLATQKSYAKEEETQEVFIHTKKSDDASQMNEFIERFNEQQYSARPHEFFIYADEKEKDLYISRRENIQTDAFSPCCMTADDVDYEMAKGKHPEILRITGMNQESLEHFVLHYGKNYRYLNFHHCQLIKDFSPLEDLSKLEEVSICWNIRANKLWDFSRNNALRSISLNSAKKISLYPDMLKTSKVLEKVHFSGGNMDSYPMESLACFAGMPALRHLSLELIKLKDRSMDVLETLPKLERFDFDPGMLTTEEIAWIVAKYPKLLGSSLCAYTDGTINDVRICGFRKPGFNLPEGQKRLDKYVAEFNALVEKYRNGA